MSFETQIIDGGTALGKDRPLATVIRMRNPFEGEYRAVCSVTADVDDAEFGFMRAPFGKCRDEVGPKLACSKQSGRFSSRWIGQ